MNSHDLTELSALCDLLDARLDHVLAVADRGLNDVPRPSCGHPLLLARVGRDLAHGVDGPGCSLTAPVEFSMKGDR